MLTEIRLTTLLWVVVVGWVATGYAGDLKTDWPPTGTFDDGTTDADYSEYPSKDWPTFGGDYSNTRFSKLDQINRDNIDRLIPAWSFSTGLAFDPVHHFMTVPLVINGVMYLTDPGNWLVRSQNVFAVDAQTGAHQRRTRHGP